MIGGVSKYDNLLDDINRPVGFKEMSKRNIGNFPTRNSAVEIEMNWNFILT